MHDVSHEYKISLDHAFVCLSFCRSCSLKIKSPFQRAQAGSSFETGAEAGKARFSSSWCCSAVSEREKRLVWTGALPNRLYMSNLLVIQQYLSFITTDQPTILIGMVYQLNKQIMALKINCVFLSQFLKPLAFQASHYAGRSLSSGNFIFEKAPNGQCPLVFVEVVVFFLQIL